MGSWKSKWEGEHDFSLHDKECNSFDDKECSSLYDKENSSSNSKEFGSLYDKTLPKAQRTRGLSSYHKSHTNLDQTSISESRLSINFKISTKHQHLDLT